MTSPEEEKKDYYAPEDDGSKQPVRSKIIRWIIIAIIVAAVIFGVKWYMGMQAMKGMMMAKQRQAAMNATPIVVLGEAQAADLANVHEYIGNVESIQTVAVKTQVSGQIVRVNFREGSIVRAGQTLFSIDSSQYAATAALRRAQISQAKAELDKAQKYLNRIKAADPRSVSATDLDTAQSTVLAAQASVAQAEASLKLAEIDLRHTRITAPITGRIGKALFTKGNYVTQSSTALATIVQMDPIRVTFNMPDRDYLDQIAQFKRPGAVFKTTLKLANGQEIAANGTRDFEDNQVSNNTGTLAIRIRYRNAQGLLIPGSMVRVSTQPVTRKMVTTIPQEAIQADAQGDFVYVVDSSNVAQLRRVQLGDEYGVSREIISGITAGEKIVVQGVQSVVPGKKVKPVKANNDSQSAAEQAKQSGSGAIVTTSKDSQGAK
jgi:RND family efflux transporter MFP subunit